MPGEKFTSDAKSREKFSVVTQKHTRRRLTFSQDKHTICTLSSRSREKKKTEKIEQQRKMALALVVSLHESSLLEMTVMCGHFEHENDSHTHETDML